MGDHLAAVILAGGQSRRMGRDKALLPVYPLSSESVKAIDVTTLLQQTCAVAKSCTDQVFVLSSTSYDLPLGCQWVSEDPPHQGPLKAFSGCLEQIKSEWILLLACDLPYLDAQALQRWIGELEQVPASSIAYLAPHTKGWECLCGFYRQQCHQSLRNFVMAGGDSFQDWLRDQDVQTIPAVESSMFINWNSPEDLFTVN
jgi:molybdenum cofactor guanylyltransferase